MKSLLLIAAFLCLFSSCSTDSPDIKPADDQVYELRSAAGDFMGRLKQVLVRNMQTRGVVNAVDVCSDSALIITSNIGKEMGLIIKRVSVKNRNPVNYPDEFENQVLNDFKELQAAGKLDASVEHAELTEYKGQKAIRYMRPIITGNVCLTCHGSQEYIPDAVKTLITEKYPQDKARGYSEGDLRGAVSIIKIIQNK